MSNPIQMKEDQIVRIACGAFATVAYTARLVTYGNGPISIFGYEPNSFAAVLIVFVILAFPETLDRLPFGPNSKQASHVPPLNKHDEKNSDSSGED